MQLHNDIPVFPVSYILRQCRESRNMAKEYRVALPILHALNGSKRRHWNYTAGLFAGKERNIEFNHATNSRCSFAGAGRVVKWGFCCTSAYYEDAMLHSHPCFSCKHFSIVSLVVYVLTLATTIWCPSKACNMVKCLQKYLHCTTKKRSVMWVTL